MGSDHSRLTLEDAEPTTVKLKGGSTSSSDKVEKISVLNSEELKLLEQLDFSDVFSPTPGAVSSLEFGATLQYASLQNSDGFDSPSLEGPSVPRPKSIRSAMRRRRDRALSDPDVKSLAASEIQSILNGLQRKQTETDVSLLTRNESLYRVRSPTEVAREERLDDLIDKRDFTKRIKERKEYLRMIDSLAMEDEDMDAEDLLGDDDDFKEVMTGEVMLSESGGISFLPKTVTSVFKSDSMLGSSSSSVTATTSASSAISTSTTAVRKLAPQKHMLMKRSTALMKINVVGLLFGDSTKSTVPGLSVLTPRSVMHSMASMSDAAGTTADSVFAFSVPEGFERTQSVVDLETDGAAKQLRARFADTPIWTGVYVVAAYKYENPLNEFLTTGAGPKGWMSKSAGAADVAKSITPDGSKKATMKFGVSPKGTGKKKRRPFKRSADDDVPADLFGSSKKKRGTTKKQRKAAASVAMTENRLRTFCYDSYDRDVLFLGETLEYAVLPFKYADHKGDKLRMAATLSRLEREIHPQILFQCFDHRQQQMIGATSKPLKKKKRFSRAPKSSAVSGSSSADTMIQPAVTTKPGCLLVYVIQDMDLVKSKEEMTSASSAKKGISPVPAASSPAAEIAAEMEDEDYPEDRPAFRGKSSLEDATGKHHHKKGSVRKLGVGFIRVRELLDTVDVPPKCAESDTHMFQIPIYPVLPNDRVSMVSLLMTKHKILGYEQLLDAAKRSDNKINPLDVQRPAAIGNVVCSVNFDWNH